MTHPLADACGRYEGEGVWRDDTGDSRRYSVEMVLQADPGGRLHQRFRHVFFEEETPDVVQNIQFIERAPSILGFDIEGLPVPGRGYHGRDLLHYTIPVPGNAVEVTYVFTPDGAVVAGSAERNANGRFIMWEERLRRTAED